MKMISDLPHELESEILCKVPANSLEKLKTTCKRWYSLFKDPRFVEKNNLGSEAAREVILLMNFMVYSIRINVHGIHHGVDPSVEITGKLKNIKVSKIFHCDGLILCTTKGKTRLVVWNPCNGETRWIEPRNGNRICGTYALGYGNNSYKVLMLRCYEIPSQRIHVSEFEIYDFSSDSWRVIDGLAVKFSLSSSLGVSLRENAYWIACHKETGLFMLTFDFTTERFGRLPLPFQSFNPQDTAALSVVREEQISVLYRSFESSSSEAKIWVSNKISEAKEVSWSDFLAVDLGGFMMEDEEAMTLDSFLLDEENKVAVCCDTDLEDEGRARIYIVGENLDIEVYKEMAKGKLCSWPFLLSYVPSLVRLQGDTARCRRKRKTRRLVK